MRLNWFWGSIPNYLHLMFKRIASTIKVFEVFTMGYLCLNIDQMSDQASVLLLNSVSFIFSSRSI
jgi:hypothetical protein